MKKLFELLVRLLAVIFGYNFLSANGALLMWRSEDAKEALCLCTLGSNIQKGNGKVQAEVTSGGKIEPQLFSRERLTSINALYPHAVFRARVLDFGPLRFTHLTHLPRRKLEE